MDPNETLRRLREYSYDTEDAYDDPSSSLEHIQDLFRALDDWITDGGFLPTDWQEV